MQYPLSKAFLSQLMHRLLTFLIYSQTSTLSIAGPWEARDPAPEPLLVRQSQSGCPEFAEYALEPHGTVSDGPLGLPHMRPPEECRTFTSPAIEGLLENVTSVLKDRDLAMFFTNALTNTLDTTIKWKSNNLAFVVTGDINAMWIRDSCNQLAIYQSLAPQDLELAKLIRGTIALQARYLSQYPYCGAFQPPAESGLAPQHNDWAEDVDLFPPVDNTTVFECKYELDSLGGFLKLSRQFYQTTGDASYLTPSWFAAVEGIFDLISNQSLPTLSENGELQSFYRFASPKIPVVNRGNGPPAAETGMVKTAFRPSDDLVQLPFHIPDNALLAVELRQLASVLDAEHLRPDLAGQARETADRVEKAVWEHGVFEHPKWGKVLAYEVDGFGGRVFMDDANVPSLLSLPYLGFLNTTDETYQNTRRMLLSQSGNPYFVRGSDFYGIGGPHVDLIHPWPMALVSLILTSTLDEEIVDNLEWLKNSTAGLGLMHESVNINNSTDFTRPWFAWANSYFAESVLRLAKERPRVLY